MDDNSYKHYLVNLDSDLTIVVDRARSLIDHQIWDTVSYESIDNWLKNFKTTDSRFLAMLLLHQFNVRSAGQTKALLKHAIEKCLPNAISSSPLQSMSQTSILTQLKSRASNRLQLKLVPVIRDTDPPTKSGPALARLYRRDLNISESHMIWPWQINKNIDNGVTTFVMIDDTLATGNQFCEFVEKFMPTETTGVNFIYIPLLAHKQGVENVNKRYPFIRVSPVEVADEESNFFNRPRIRELSDLRDLYTEVTKSCINKRLFRKMGYGYDDLSMTISFSHSTPNASLPLYWYEDDNFSPLVSR